jgi:hypothetical protein
MEVLQHARDGACTKDDVAKIRKLAPTDENCRMASNMGATIRECWIRDAQGCTESIMVGEVSEEVGEVMHMAGGGQGRSAHGQKGSEGVGEALGARPGKNGS